MTADYEQYDPECPKVIRQSWDSITKIGAASKDGPEWLSETFKLCTPITNSTGVDILKEYLNELYTNLAMMNYPYPTDFIGHLPGFPVNVNIASIDLVQIKIDQILDRSHHQHVRSF